MSPDLLAELKLDPKDPCFAEDVVELVDELIEGDGAFADSARAFLVELLMYQAVVSDESCAAEIREDGQ
jgi:hypothetical protein